MSRPFVLALLLCACGESESSREERAMKEASPARAQPDGSVRLSESDRTALGLVVQPASAGKLANVALRFGRVNARAGEEALVIAPIAGRVAQPPSVRPGQQVAAGAPLVEIAPLLGTAERVSLGVQGAETQGQIEGAQADLARREADAERARELAGSKIISAARLQETEAALSGTRSRLEALLRSRNVQGGGRGRGATLRAPIGGVLASLEARLGQSVAAGQVVARVVRPGPRWVDLPVAEGDPSGDGYEIASGAGWLPAKLLSRGAIVEPDGNRHDLLLADGAASVLPGAVVNVRVARGAESGIVLPETALVPGIGTDTVYVEGPAGTFVPRRVGIAARFGGKVRVSSGLKPGEPVVTQGAMALHGEALRSQLRAQD